MTFFVQTDERNLRELLGNKDKDGTEKVLNKGGIHVVSAFKYSPATHTASFWLRKDVVDELVRGQKIGMRDGRKLFWMPHIWRTDTWRKEEEYPRVEKVVKGRRWTDEDED